MSAERGEERGDETSRAGEENRRSSEGATDGGRKDFIPTEERRWDSSSSSV